MGCSCSVNRWDILCPYCSDWVDFYTNYDMIEKEPRGHPVLTAVRRWWRRLGDWLDPHAAHDREYAELLRLWLRQRADLDGREPGPDAGER